MICGSTNCPGTDSHRQNTKQRNISAYSHVSVLKQPRSHTEIKTYSCKANSHDSDRLETMLFAVNKITDMHLHPSHRKTRPV